MFFIGLIGTLGALWQYRRTPPPRLSSKDPGLPGVTVLRPLKGLDANLEENLLSVLNQDYPPEKLEVIISVASPMDPAVPLARSLAKTYRNCTLHIGESPLGRNPKVRNLAQPFKQAKHDLIWTMDSNVSLSSPGTLLRAIERFQAGAGLVHHLPVALLPSTNCLSGALLESAFLGTAHAKLYTFFNTLGFASCVIGKSHFYSRSVLEGLTDGKGIECFRDNLAEDNSVAKLLWGAGFRWVWSGT
jgi:ceramide glucosyltransferase